MITKERLFAFAMIIIVVALIVAEILAFVTTHITESNKVARLKPFNRLLIAGICTYFAGLAGICAVPTVMEFVARFIDEQSNLFLVVYTAIIGLSILIYGFAVYGLVELTVTLRKKVLKKKVKAH